MAAIVSVIAVVLISMLINRVATIALSLTGMSREEARFQARAAMSGVGLTTAPGGRPVLSVVPVPDRAGGPRAHTGHRPDPQSRGYDVRDFDTLLALSGNDTVAELRVRQGDWIAERTLRDLRLRDEGVVVMGIQREGVGYIGAPKPDETVCAGDTLVVYRTADRISELDRRQRGAAGESAHARACGNGQPSEVSPRRSQSSATD